MQVPRFVRPPTEQERQAPAIARSLGYSDQTVRNAIHAFDREEVAALAAGFSRPIHGSCTNGRLTQPVSNGVQNED